MVMLDQLMGGRCVLYKDKINMKLPGAGGFEPHQDILAGWGSYNVSNFVTFQRVPTGGFRNFRNQPWQFKGYL